MKFCRPLATSPLLSSVTESPGNPPSFVPAWTTKFVTSKQEERARREHVPAFAFALAQTGLGDLERAFEWLERGIVDRDELLAENFLDPLFDPLCDDARYEGVLARIGATRP